VDTATARELFERYRASVAYVEVEDPALGRQMGTAFHVGDGVFVTARHVVEGNTVLEVGTTEQVYVPLEGEAATTASTFVHRGDGPAEAVHVVRPSLLAIDQGPLVQSDPQVDVAVFRVADLDPLTPAIPLGGHLDDWLGESDFTLTGVLVLGYPPLPRARRPHLVAARADVIAQIDRYDVPHVHFILSAMPRGGFSGGLALSEFGMVLGVVTDSIVSDDKPPELGYLSVTSIEPIYVCLANHRMLPEAQAEGWDDLWNTQGIHLGAPQSRLASQFRLPDEAEMLEIAAWVKLFDDGERIYRS